jgi:hypothetical protein
MSPLASPHTVALQPFRAVIVPSFAGPGRYSEQTTDALTHDVLSKYHHAHERATLRRAPNDRLSTKPEQHSGQPYEIPH